MRRNEKERIKYILINVGVIILIIIATFTRLKMMLIGLQQIIYIFLDNSFFSI